MKTNTTPYIYSPEQHKRIVEGGATYETKISYYKHSRPREKKYEGICEISEMKKKVDHSQLGDKSNENRTEEHRVIKWIRDCEHPVVDLMDDSPKVLGFAFRE